MHPNIESDSQSLGSTFLRTYWIFQAIFAGPISAALAISAFVRLLDLHGPLYDFVTQICTAILSAGIVFIVLVQRKLDKSYSSKSLTLKFEIAKSIFATALWVWCMLDAALGPESEFDYYKRPPRVGSAAVASIVLVVLFYPTVVFAARDVMRTPEVCNDCLASDVDEWTPLLRM